MGIIDDLAGRDVEALFDELDEIFSEAGERRRFIADCEKLQIEDVAFLQAVLGRSIKKAEMLAEIESVREPLKVVETLLNLTTELERTQNELLIDFFFRLLQANGVYEELSRDADSYWEASLLLNPRLQADHVSFIWERRKKAYLREADPYGAMLTVRNPATPVNVLEELLELDDRTVQSGIARHPNISDSIIRRFLNSTRKPDRKALAGNQHVSAEVLMALMRDRYDDVVKSAKRNMLNRFPESSLDDAAIDAAVSVYVDQPQASKPKKQTSTFDPAAAEALGQDHVVSLKDAAQRKRVARLTTDGDLLRILANDSSAAVRRVVASTGFCPLDALRELVDDSDVQTCRNALENLLRANPNVAVEDLVGQSVLDSGYDDVNTILARQGEKDIHDVKLSAKEQATFERAELVARHSRNELLQLQILQKCDDDTSVFTFLGRFRSSLVRNKHLCPSAARKLVLELRHGKSNVVGNCTDIDLLEEFASDSRLDSTTRKIAMDTLDRLAKQS